jgi:hypothetical protein
VKVSQAKGERWVKEEELLEMEEVPSWRRNEY